MSNPPVPSLLAKLLERLQGREALDLEFKSAQGGLPKELWPTVSAFANTSGGWIVLGVAEREDEIAIDGVGKPQYQLKTIHDQLRNPQKLSFPVCSVDDVCVEALGEKQVIVLRVPAASRKERPVYINGNPYGGTYVRRHSADYHCTKPEVDRMMREASDLAVDSTILTNFDLDDFDREALARYRRRFQTQRPASAFNDYDDRRFFQAIGGQGRERGAGKVGITVAGLLMFGTPQALREWRGRHLIDYRLLSSDADSDVRWEDRVVWEGNLLGAFETIYRQRRLHPICPKSVRGKPSRRLRDDLSALSRWPAGAI